MGSGGLVGSPANEELSRARCASASGHSSPVTLRQASASRGLAAVQDNKFAIRGAVARVQGGLQGGHAGVRQQGHDAATRSRRRSCGHHLRGRWRRCTA